MKKLLYLFAFLMVGAVGAQEEYAPVIQNYLNSNRTSTGLQSQDIAEINVNSSAYSKSMNLQTVYASQMHNGIEVFNSVSSFAVKNGQVVSAATSFESNVASRVNTITPSLQPETAVSRAATALGLATPSGMELLETNGNSYLYSNGSISLDDIPVKLVYFVEEDNSMRLAWDLSIYLLDASHYYHVRIDATNGQLLDTIDWVVSCDFGEGDHAHSNEATSILFKEEAPAMEVSAMGGAAYNVFAMPLSNPNDGAESVVSSPEDLTASPFGWHDTDGAGGAEFTITRGNNVHAQEDINGNNGTGVSPDGGATLDFSTFAYGLPQAPGNFTDAATVNLFYWNNICHDVTYQYGFDEESGNFQENNYGNPGNGSDSVNADAQDGSGTNNANFATPPDGGNPRMQMFIWDPSPFLDLLTVNNGPLAGTYAAVAADYGAPMPASPLTEDMVLVEDDDSGASTDPNDACDTITNGADLNGKIAVIRRGACEFGFKSLAAETEGAIAVIMVNNVAGDPIVMGGGAVGGSVTIPCLMINNIDGEALIAEIQANTTNATIEAVAVGDNLDGDLDNEIIAHEYAHGVSNRLTGGPVNVSCLGNADQMGEGWSDYLGLILTMQPGDQAEDIRGLANYAAGQGIQGSGIREAPYTTDTAINGFTYADTNSGVSQPHGIGFVWATMLWDMTWAFIDEYGFDADIYAGTGGNNIAFQLVMDGMKLQACSPGFVDGRDAIIMADELANAGANKCRIWEAFAARGLGVSASQGSTNNRADAVEAFDLPAECNLSISDNEFSRNFSIYPNPSNGEINISSVVSLGATDISILDMNGRTVFTQTVELGNKASIEATNLNTGIYIIKIDGGNYVHTAKLVIK